MKEILTIQSGQCGNQISKSFWDQLYIDHQNLEGSYNKFFFETRGGLQNRVLMLDSEPRAVESIFNANFPQNNILMPETKIGSGNNWAIGYETAKGMETQIKETIQAELEGCDNLEGFNLMHSTAGGTGSGFTSFIMQCIKELYPKKITSTVSVLPSLEISETVVQPYNSVLSLSDILDADNPIIVDNSSLFRLSDGQVNLEEPSNFSSANYFLGSAMACITKTLRFPSFVFSDMQSISSALNIGSLNLKTFSCNFKAKRKSKIESTLQKLQNRNNKFANLTSGTKNELVSSLNLIFDNDVSCSALKTASLNFCDKPSTNFVNWMPPSYFALNLSSTPEINPYDAVSLTNSTGLNDTLIKLCGQFDKLKSRGAFLDVYKKYDDKLEKFDLARSKIQNIIEEYSSASNIL